MAYARHQFAMSKRQPDGRTVREHLVFARDKARDPAKRAKLAADVDGPPLPAAFRPLWDAFMELHRWRGVGAMSMAPLTLHDIEAWERRYLPRGCRLTPDDLDVLKRLDGAALTEH